MCVKNIRLFSGSSKLGLQELVDCLEVWRCAKQNTYYIFYYKQYKILV